MDLTGGDATPILSPADDGGYDPSIAESEELRRHLKSRLNEVGEADDIGDMIPLTPQEDDDDDDAPRVIEDPIDVDADQVDDASREAEPSAEPRSKGSSSSVSDIGNAKKRIAGNNALRAEAKSNNRHLLTHMPKNPFCDVCSRAKMQKPPSYSVGGSRQVKADKFGEHVTADFLVVGDEEGLGLDDEKVALVIKDVATDFIYIYPSARRSAKETILALKHFVGHRDEVGVFYSDNAPELISALEQLQWRHVLSKPYISKSNAVAERAIRSVLEGARVNLCQAGLHHIYWPHAARHWCFMQDVLNNQSGTSPWKLRFGDHSKDPCVPFGALVHYWMGPSKKQKGNLRFEPTSSPGVFLGYVVHPEFMFRKEYFVAPLKSLIDSPMAEASTVLRVSKIDIPQSVSFPVAENQKLISGDSVEAQVDRIEELIERTFEDQDAKPVREPEPKVKDIEAGEPVESSMANAVHHPVWLAFMKHVDFQEGWFEYAGCHVNAKEFSETYVKPIDKFNASDFPFRTTCYKLDNAWFVLEENLKIDPATWILKQKH